MMTYPVFRLLINNWKCSCLVYKTICDGSQMGFWFHYLIMYETSSLFLITELVVLKVCNRLSVIYFTSWNREQGKKRNLGRKVDMVESACYCCLFLRWLDMLNQHLQRPFSVGNASFWYLFLGFTQIQPL